jgi:hypothetical protein
MFSYAADYKHSIAVFLFSAVADESDQHPCGQALLEFHSRVRRIALPAVVLVDESRHDGLAWDFPTSFRAHNAEEPRITLLAVVGPPPRGVTRAVRSAVASRYFVYPAHWLWEAVAWVERHRQLELAPVFARLLSEARSVTGPNRLH